MHLFAILILISSIFILSVGIFVYSQNRKSPINRVFLFLCILAFYFSFIESMLHDADSISSAYLWLKLTALWTFLPAVFFHFTLVFTKSGLLRRSRWIPVLIYAPAALFSIIELTTDLITTTPVLKYWGYTYGYSPHPLPFLVELAWMFGLFGVSLLLITRHYFRTPEVQEKKQIKCIMIGFSVVVIVTFVSEIVFPFFQINLPTTETISILFFFALIGYAIWKYELFVVSPAMAADNIVSTMTDSLILLDNSHTIISVNDATLKILRYRKEELIGLPFSAIFSDPAGTEAILSGITVSGPVTDLETSYRSKEGIAIPISFSGSVIRDAKGDSIGTVCISRDITERKRAEDALRESEEKLRTLFNNANDMITLHGFDASGMPGTYIEVNDAACRRLKYSREELLSKSPKDIVAPETLNRMAQNTRALRATGNATFEMIHLTKDQQRIPVEISAHLFDFKGKPHVLSMVRDITERKQVEEALHLFKDLVDHSSDAIGMSTPEGRHYYQNEAFNRLFGDIGNNPPETAYVDKAIGKRVFDTIRGGGNWQGEVKMFRKDRTILDIFLRAYAIRNPKGHTIGLVGLHTDITERKRVEENLKASEEKFHAVFENANDAILLIAISPDGLPEKFVEVNETACRRLKYTREEFLGLSLREIDAQETWEKIRENMKNLLEKGHATFEGVHVTRDRERIPVEVSAHAFNHHGQELVLAHVRDITERKRAEHDLRESEIKYRSILDNIQDAFYRSDRDGNLIMISPSGAKLLGVISIDELLGLNIAEKIYANPDDRIKLLDVMEKYGFVEDFEVDLRRKDGSVVTVSTSSHYYFDSSGELEGVEGIFRDITERKEAEEALKKSERIMKDIISFLPDATFVIDKNGEVIAWNHAMVEMTGVPAEQMIGKGNYEYALPLYHERRPITIDLVLHDDPTVTAKYLVMKKEGSTRFSEIFIPHFNKGKGAHLWFAATPLYDADGNLMGAIESIRDITALKQANEQLHLLLREKEILLREIHHRVRNTLQLAVSMMKIQSRRENNTRVRDALFDTQNRLNAIASTFDMIYHSEDISRVNLRNIISSIVGSIRSAYETREHHIQSDIRIDITEMGVDLALPLALIISELVINAFQNAFPDGRSGMVTITGSEDEHGQIILTVNDNGSGLPEGLDPAESGTTGFTLVRTLVQQIDGVLSYETSGKGTGFIITVSRDAEFKKSGVSEV
ncbi:PAS domain S-box protein [Methanoregula sp.]|uniref:PAS domain S-box protein n=1 Tax=Methanoregula sp. TaxID=2052170 RepID=UPI0035642C45